MDSLHQTQDSCSDDSSTASAAPMLLTQSELTTTIAKLRAFSFLLCLDPAMADELVEITLVRAKVGIDPASLGENLSPWLIRRLRGYYFREYAGRPASGMRPIGPFDQTEHAEIVTALGKLPADQREALVLVEAAGFSFTEAGHICRCPRVRFRNLVTSAQQTLGSLLSKRRSEKRAAIRLVFLASADHRFRHA